MATNYQTISLPQVVMRWMRDHSRDYPDREALVRAAAKAFGIYELADPGTPLPQWLYDTADKMPRMSPAY